MLGSLILYLKGMRTIMFQLSGFYCKPKVPNFPNSQPSSSKPKDGDAARDLLLSAEPSKK